MTLRTTLRAALFGATALALTATGALADMLEDIKAAGKITTATEMHYAPFDMLENGQYAGFNKELFDEVAKELGVAAEYQDLPWASILPGLEVSKFDFVNAPVTITPERMERYAFTLPISDATVALVQRKGGDLTKPEDEAWLVSRVSALQPALLVIGPIYRLHAKNPNDEEPARCVTRVLDRCRAAANCALILEAHAGHTTGVDGMRHVRPTGSSLWLRWPEFGYGLRAADGFHPTDNRVVDFVAWRGDREERQWPQQLRGGGVWPWMVHESNQGGVM